MDLNTILFLATTILSGLIAGLLYSFACAIIPGLGTLANKEYIKAVQAINESIQNPSFFMSFIGTLILLPVCSYITYTQSGTSLKFMILILSTLIYIIGVAGVTILGNVPLNNYLHSTTITDVPLAELQSIRAKFEMRWNALHNIRTVASIFSFALLLIANYIIIE